MRRFGPSHPASACPFYTLRLNLVLSHGVLPDSRSGVHLIIIPPYTIGSVPSLSCHAIACRWRSLPSVRRHRASSPQRMFHTRYTFFLRQLLFHGSTLTQGNRCGQEDCSENIIRFSRGGSRFCGDWLSYCLPVAPVVQLATSSLLMHPRQREAQESRENMMYRAYCINGVTLKGKHSGRP